MAAESRESLRAREALRRQSSSAANPTEFTGLWLVDEGSSVLTEIGKSISRPVSSAVHSARKAKAALIRILVVDDNPAVRHYLRAILEQQSCWQVCGEASTGADAFDRMQQSHPDVVLLDFQMPDVNGLDVARKMQHSSPGIPILMVTVHMSNQLAAAARAVGIRGACAKSDVGSIVDAVRTLLDGRSYFPETMSMNG